jgi:hypothetical protein
LTYNVEMPPRYAYWTILIDGKPTAFRAREQAELLPTLQQLRRKNPDVAMKWFARGRLWDNPEQAQWAGKHQEREKRGRDWRPGGQHRDPRAKFDKRRRDAQARKPAGHGSKAPRSRSGTPQDVKDRQFKDTGTRVNARSKGFKGRNKPSVAGGHAERPRVKKAAGAPRDRFREGKPAGAPRDRFREGKPAGPPRGGRPWRENARAHKPSVAPRKWQPDRTPERRDAEPRPKPPNQEAPEKPPAPEQIVIKPEPPERG